MKFMNKYKYWAAVLLLCTFVSQCMSIEEIIHPQDAQVDSDIDISVKIKLVPETDQTTKLIFAVLAPKSWNIAQNAQLTITTTGYTQGSGGVTNEPLTLVPATDTEFTTAKAWSAAFQSTVGLMGNLGPVEWVVFQSSTAFQISDQSPDKEINATVKIRLHTGPQAIKCFMGYTFCGKDKGFDSEKYKKNATAKVLEISGGSLPPLDFTEISLVSTIPSSFRYGDVFSVVFEEKTATNTTPLVGAKAVYLCGRVIYDGGKEKEIIVSGPKNLMEKVGDTTWQKYIYPREFFGLPEGAVIEKTYFHFTNADRSIIVKDGEEEFLIMQAAE